jgi:hypothetical protein
LANPLAQKQVVGGISVFWPLADIPFAPLMSAFGDKADIEMSFYFRF